MTSLHGYIYITMHSDCTILILMVHTIHGILVCNSRERLSLTYIGQESVQSLSIVY